MLGAIIGDIVGSRFEFNNHRSKDFELFADGCFVTDDSIMTLAVAKALMEAVKIGEPLPDCVDPDFHSRLASLTVQYMQEIGRKYPDCGYGGRFGQWVFSRDPKPYNSFGNGAAMRVSPVGFFARSRQEAEELARTVTAVTHNHPEGIKGAVATATAVFLANNGALKSEIREQIHSDYYPLDFKIDEIRASYCFNETCQETVPQAIECFLESSSFEDAIRIAISLGGDSDTVAAITGAIAAAYYGEPEDLKIRALAYLDEELRAIYDEWVAFLPASGERYKLLTKYIGSLTDRTMIYKDFESEWIQSDFPFGNYRELLAEMNVALDISQIIAKESADLTASQVLALITAAFRNDHFDNGIIVEYLRSGAMRKWLQRLKDLDCK